MTLLEHYLKAVRLYLPRGASQGDIINELSELLQSTMDEKEEALGRPLTEEEQEAILTKHGNPMAVARRYGVKNRSVSFGWQLIGPELFPLYARILAVNWGLTLLVPFIIPLFTTEPVMGRTLSWWGALTPMLIQFAIVTTIFTCIDYFQRRAKSASSWLHEDSHWQFPPPYFQRVPRWQSLSGGLVLLAALVWWALVPIAPQLVLGRLAARFDVVPAIRWLYGPVLMLLVIGVAQRAVVFLHPERNWLQMFTRLFTNFAAVALVFPFALSYPAVVAKDVANGDAVAGALRISDGLWWLIVPSFALYWLINAGFHVWMCAQYVRHARRRRLQQSVS